MELNREHFRAIIFHNFRRGLSRQECFDELNSLYSDKAPSYSTVKNWYNEFNRGRCSIQDESRAGRPKSVVVPEKINAVRELIKQDRHVTYREIEASLDISDESWIYAYEPETKQQSTVWVFQDEAKPTKVVRGRSTSKQMIACFFGINGHVATVALEQRRTVNSEWYTTICLPEILVGSDCCPPAGGEATYDSRLLSFPSARLSGFGLYGASYAASNSFYTALPSPYDLKESRSSWSALQQSSAAACYPYDPSGLATCASYPDSGNNCVPKASPVADTIMRVCSLNCGPRGTRISQNGFLNIGNGDENENV
ncbi:uncharacterized protein NPIL_581791 [Nephila pilipes]|uniref:Mos1 transposase HTH domain-containing protein n=1 Tax=Nephila pilipes TaxID=299642 RepID=A0A8X6NU95_NEPPI|nr:uncharacterized protein NPIL_581791 [Nephila pilipes]